MYTRLFFLLVIIGLTSCTNQAVELPAESNDNSSFQPDEQTQAIIDSHTEVVAEKLETAIASTPLSIRDVPTLEAELATLSAEYNTPHPTPTIQLGIINEGEIFQIHPPRTVAIENIWQGYVDGVLTRVYAGLSKPDSRTDHPQTHHGIVYIVYDLPDNSYPGVAPFRTEEEVGALRIVDVIDHMLVLQSAGYGERESETFYFDLLNRSFSDSVYR